MRQTKQEKIKLYRRDVEFFENRARSGQIAKNLVRPSAILLSAMRDLQITASGGYFPLDTIFDALPADYRKNWLRKKGAQV